MENKIIDTQKLGKDTLEALKYLPSAAFGSSRYKLDDYNVNEKDYKVISNIFDRLKIKYFFCIGGNDSMDICNKIYSYAQHIGYEIYVIGVPKTIDNGLLETDHCPGFASAAKFAINAGIGLWLDINAYEKESIMIMEVMGRDTGCSIPQPPCYRNWYLT